MEIGFEVAIDIALDTPVGQGKQVGQGLFPQHPGITVLDSQTESGVATIEKAGTDLGLDGRFRFGAGSFQATAPHP